MVWIPISFDTMNHLDRTARVGVIPLIVSPMLNNFKVMNILIDGSTGLNILSAKLLEKL
jgi:hypothetical protein